MVTQGMPVGQPAHILPVPDVLIAHGNGWCENSSKVLRSDIDPWQDFVPAFGPARSQGETGLKPGINTFSIFVALLF